MAPSVSPSTVCGQNWSPRQWKQAWMAATEGAIDALRPSPRSRLPLLQELLGRPQQGDLGALTACGARGGDETGVERTVTREEGGLDARVGQLLLEAAGLGVVAAIEDHVGVGRLGLVDGGREVLGLRVDVVGALGADARL